MPRRPLTNFLRVVALLAALAGSSRPSAAGAQTSFPARVLLTNDNGIDDPKLVALARAFAQRAEVWVVAPNSDRSGSGAYLTVTRTGRLSVERRDLGEGITAYAVDGYPADCVVLALAGMMRTALPDLVVSGINGGENLGEAWLGSGTIGAARVAALAGIPAIAVSGLNDGLPGAVDAVVSWVVALAESPVVQNLQPLEYLTVSLPRIRPDSIRGIRVTDRAPLRMVPRMEARTSSEWAIVGATDLGLALPANSDQRAWNDGYIAVVPMRADEVDLTRLADWQRLGVELPEWRTAPGRR
jgi:5'-nucleotidase